MNTKEVLIAARALIAKGWCRGTAAKDKANRPVPVGDPAACKFCSVGALWRVSPHELYGVFDTTTKLLSSLTPDQNIAGFNDSKRNKRDVLRIFDKVIATLP